MAKELPYFKFEPNQWENGNIQMLTREEKGLFIDLCSIYWSRLGDMPERLVIQKLCGGNASALGSLYEEEVIALRDEKIVIEFLDEQLLERKVISKKNKENADKRWAEARKNKALSEGNATASKSQYENHTKRREEKRKEEKRFNYKSELKNRGVPDNLIEEFIQVRKTRKAVNSETSLNSLINQIEKSKLSVKDAIKYCVEHSWAHFKPEWYQRNEGKEIKPQVTTLKPTPVER